MYIYIFFLRILYLFMHSLQQSSFHNFKFALHFFFGLISRVGCFVAFGDSVGALTVTDVTEIHKLAGFMGQLYTRGARENRGRRRIDWLNNGYYMCIQDL